MASGLACIVSPMAAGEIGRSGVDCLVADPLDTEAWVQAIRRHAGDEGERRKLGEQARLRAQEFTWEKVALRRRAQLQEAFRRSPPGRRPQPGVSAS
jgi:glycosyltransferase involved in cell wall biosynthesis